MQSRTESHLGAGLSYKLLIDGVATKHQELKVPEFVIDSMSKIKDALYPFIKDSKDNKEVSEKFNKIFDSATVVKEVVKNAFTISSQVITTKCLIHENIR